MCPPAVLPVISAAHKVQIPAVLARQAVAAIREVAKSLAVLAQSLLVAEEVVAITTAATTPVIVVLPLIWRRLGSTCVARS
jgi:hypothetical protein